MQSRFLDLEVVVDLASRTLLYFPSARDIPSFWPAGPEPFFLFTVRLPADKTWWPWVASRWRLCHALNRYRGGHGKWLGLWMHETRAYLGKGKGAHVGMTGIYSTGKYVLHIPHQPYPRPKHVLYVCFSCLSFEQLGKAHTWSSFVVCWRAPGRHMTSTIPRVHACTLE